VWGRAEDDLRATCRYWSGTSFAPRSTHFYSSSDAECAALRERPEWLFEGDLFGVRLVEGRGLERGCPSATVPLYRSYNNGQGGAPNHRYTTDAGVLAQMVGQGWTAEGELPGRIVACVPAR
jgi:hypothetical protein